MYLASEEGGWINGRVVGAQGGRVTLYSNYAAEQSVVSAQPWTIDSIFAEMPKTFHPERQGLAGIG